MCNFFILCNDLQEIKVPLFGNIKIKGRKNETPPKKTEKWRNVIRPKRGKELLKIDFHLSISQTFFLPKIRLRMNRTIKIKKRILAIPAAPAAMPPKPKIAATMAMIKNVMA